MSLLPIRPEGAPDWALAVVCDHCTNAILPTEQAVALWDARGDVLDTFRTPLTLHAPTCQLRMQVRLPSLEDWQSMPLIHFVAELARAVHPLGGPPASPLDAFVDSIRADQEHP